MLNLMSNSVEREYTHKFCQNNDLGQLYFIDSQFFSGEPVRVIFRKYILFGTMRLKKTGDRDSEGQVPKLPNSPDVRATIPTFRGYPHHASHPGRSRLSPVVSPLLSAALEPPNSDRRMRA